MTQDKALEILKSGQNVFLTGQPGCGKTHTINKFVEDCQENRIYPAITASTGIAATHIGGVTIHSWSGIGDLLDDIDQGKEIHDVHIELIAEKPWIHHKIRRTEVLIIDEVSMLSGALLDIVDRVCRHVKGRDKVFGGMQVILVGDLFQLPPVTKGDKEVDFVYKSEVWDKLDLKVCVIDEQHRQEDMVFLEILTAMRNGNLTPKHKKHLEKRMKLNIEKDFAVTKLYTHNGDVDALNTNELKKLEGELKSYGMEEGGNPNLVKILKRNCLSPEMLKLKLGALVMFTRNNPDEGYVNGTLGIVVDWNNGRPVVEVGKGDETMRIVPDYMEWAVKREGSKEAWISQIPLRLAWAMTVHKSQGMSLDSAIIDLSRSFEFGQGYVALSRVRSLEGLFLEGLNDQALLMHPEIIEKDKEFVAASLLLERAGFNYINK